MLPGLLLALAAAGGPQGEPLLEPRVRVDPAAAEVGEPVRLSLELEHPARLVVSLGPDALRADGTWVVLGGEPPLTLPLPARPGWARTRASFELACLEPGPRAVPDVELALAEPGSEERPGLLAGGATLEVRGLLPEGDVPAPGAKGFLPVEAGAGAWSRTWWLVPPLLLAALAALLAARARARRPAPAVPPSALERLAALAQGPLAEPDAVQSAYVQACHLLRAQIDRRARRDRAGLTDVEWLESASRDLDAALRAELEALLLSSAEVRYGTARPTAWAAREQLERARALLQALEAPAGTGEGVAA